jgi:hypothetical protein
MQPQTGGGVSAEMISLEKGGWGQDYHWVRHVGSATPMAQVLGLYLTPFHCPRVMLNSHCPGQALSTLVLGGEPWFCPRPGLSANPHFSSQELRAALSSLHWLQKAQERKGLAQGHRAIDEAGRDQVPPSPPLFFSGDPKPISSCSDLPQFTQWS